MAYMLNAYLKVIASITCQGVDDMEECSSTSTDFRKLLDSRRPSPVSVLEPSFSTESGSSLDSADSSSMEEGKAAHS